MDAATRGSAGKAPPSACAPPPTEPAAAGGRRVARRGTGPARPRERGEHAPEQPRATRRRREREPGPRATPARPRPGAGSEVQWGRAEGWAEPAPHANAIRATEAHAPRRGSSRALERATARPEGASATPERRARRRSGRAWPAPPRRLKCYSKKKELPTSAGAHALGGALPARLLF
jgi:hypothetical protein